MMRRFLLTAITFLACAGLWAQEVLSSQKINGIMYQPYEDSDGTNRFWCYEVSGGFLNDEVWVAYDSEFFEQLTDDEITIDIAAFIEVDGHPYPVKRISSNAFTRFPKPLRIKIPETIDYFYGVDRCNLIGLTIDENNNSLVVEDDMVFNKEKTGIYYYLPYKSDVSFTVPDNVTWFHGVQDNPYLETIQIPATCSSVGYFSNCSNLRNVTLPEGIIEMPQIYDCPQLTSITIPESVKIIREHTFAGSGLQEITIPANVVYIGNGAFATCSDLRFVNILATTPPTLGGKYVFTGLPSDYVIQVPTSPDIVAQYKVQWNQYSGHIGGESDGTIGSAGGALISRGGVKYYLKSEIQEGPEYGETYYYVVGNGTEGGGFVSGYEEGKDVWNSETDRNEWVSTPVSSRQIASTINGIPVRGIEPNAFKNCTELTAIGIPSSLEYVGSRAFEGCTGLTSVAVPCRIEASAFQHCSNLEEVLLLGGNGTSTTDACFDETNNCPIYVVDNIYDSWQEAYPDRVKKMTEKDLVILDGVKYYKVANDGESTEYHYEVGRHFDESAPINTFRLTLPQLDEDTGQPMYHDSEQHDPVLKQVEFSAYGYLHHGQFYTGDIDQNFGKVLLDFEDENELAEYTFLTNETEPGYYNNVEDFPTEVIQHITKSAYLNNSGFDEATALTSTRENMGVSHKLIRLIILGQIDDVQVTAINPYAFVDEDYYNDYGYYNSNPETWYDVSIGGEIEKIQPFQVYVDSLIFEAAQDPVDDDKWNNGYWVENNLNMGGESSITANIVKILRNMGQWGNGYRYFFRLRDNNNKVFVPNTQLSTYMGNWTDINTKIYPITTTSKGITISEGVKYYLQEGGEYNPCTYCGAEEMHWHVGDAGEKGRIWDDRQQCEVDYFEGVAGSAYDAPTCRRGMNMEWEYTICLVNIPSVMRYVPPQEYDEWGNLMPSNDWREGEYPVTAVAPRAFQGCTDITDVLFGSHVWNEETRQEDFVPNENLTLIGDAAFENCTNLTRVDLPKNLASLGSAFLKGGAFAECSSLKKMSIPKLVTSLYGTFSRCTQLEEVVFEEGSLLETLEYPFDYCTNLKSVYINGTRVSQVNLQGVIGLSDGGNPPSLNNDIPGAGTVLQYVIYVPTDVYALRNNETEYPYYKIDFSTPVNVEWWNEGSHNTASMNPYGKITIQPRAICGTEEMRCDYTIQDRDGNYYVVDTEMETPSGHEVYKNVATGERWFYDETDAHWYGYGYDYTSSTHYYVEGDFIYHIKTAEGLVWVAHQTNQILTLTDEQINSGKGVEDWSYGKSFVLDNDIDISGYNWTPIGNSVRPFVGVFDGNGKTITGLHISEDGSSASFYAAEPRIEWDENPETHEMECRIVPQELTTYTPLGLFGAVGSSLVSYEASDQTRLGLQQDSGRGTIANLKLDGVTIDVTNYNADHGGNTSNELNVGGLVGSLYVDGGVVDCEVSNVNITVQNNNGKPCCGAIAGFVYGDVESRINMPTVDSYAPYYINPISCNYYTSSTITRYDGEDKENGTSKNDGIAVGNYGWDFGGSFSDAAQDIDDGEDAMVADKLTFDDCILTVTGDDTYNGQAKNLQLTVTKGGEVIANTNYDLGEYGRENDGMYVCRTGYIKTETDIETPDDISLFDWEYYEPEAKNAGTYYVRISGTGDYRKNSKLTAKFVIQPKELQEDFVNIPATTFTGAEQTANVTVTDTELEEGAQPIGRNDYDINAESGTNAGEYNVTVTGKGNYTGMVSSKKFVINKANFNNVTVGSVDEVKMLGSQAYTPTPEVTLDDYTLTSDDYSLSYENNDKVGTATVTLTSTNQNFESGSKQITFTIKRDLGSIRFNSDRIWQTYYAAEDLALPENVTVHTVLSVTNDVIAISDNLGYIPQGVGVLLSSESELSEMAAEAYTGEKKTFGNGAGEESKGLLVGSLEPIENLPANSYILYDNAFILVNGGTLPANRCYLPLAGVSGGDAPMRLVIGGGDDEDATAIAQLEVVIDGAVYDLSGRKVADSYRKSVENHTLPSGLYLVNGKKVMVK
ncbi:MAG: leucine-rich repeat domain-containing protein [Bacteroidaceae bacterium]|nr:leucine-rich repeat domain-containing protein [Bacteroidaceae bacterium]